MLFGEKILSYGGGLDIEPVRASSKLPECVNQLATEPKNGPQSNLADMRNGAVLLIPAYRPSTALLELVQEIISEKPECICAVVVVDDGSGPEFRPIFNALDTQEGVTVLRHAVNLGKGAALKTGFNHALLAFEHSAGVVTADADGQHAVSDILNLARQLAADPDRIALGVRSFSGEVPLRSRFGNGITRYVFLVFTGMNLTDTQTGLRTWPRWYCLESLTIPINGYDFELECLLKAHSGAGGRKLAVLQVPIKTIYLDGNATSHFNPIRDSMRIYFVFARYCGTSMMAAVIDSLVFYLVYNGTGNLIASQVSGRAVAMAAVFLLVRNVVFRSDAKISVSLAKYVLLAIAMGSISYTILNYLQAAAGMPVLLSKLTAEGLLFLASFSLQRQVVFGRSKIAKPEAEL